MPKRDLVAELKALKLFGMASAWSDVLSQGTFALTEQTSQWLLAHLLDAESTDRHIRSIRYQLHAAPFLFIAIWLALTSRRQALTPRSSNNWPPLNLLMRRTTWCCGGTGTGKTHLATALGVAGITQQGKRVRFLFDGGSGQSTGAGGSFPASRGA